jgi:glycosyltransferase involved in cell wall biosynthesis/predicted metal-dependent phosphoesterase TrpH
VPAPRGPPTGHTTTAASPQWETFAEKFTSPSQVGSQVVTKSGRLQPNLRYMNATIGCANGGDATVGYAKVGDAASADAIVGEANVARVDLHCHSSASEVSRLGVQRAVGLPECATPPQEVYELAKRRGMDFVTITDHDTIDGVLQIADRPDVFVSEELTAHFRGEPGAAVHVLCYGIGPDDHEWLQANRGDVEACAGYMHERGIVCALAHPYYTVAAPLTARHRRRLADVFAIWEVRNGARARELNRPAAIYVNTRNGIGIGGSDDHAGVDIGRTYTETPPARTPAEYLAHLRTGRTVARGEQGSAAKWAHAAIALAARTLGAGAAADAQAPQALKAPDPGMVLQMVERIVREGDARQGKAKGDLCPQDARSLLRAWLAAVELDELDERGLIEYMQDGGFTHADLRRRACRAHERKLRDAVQAVVGALAAPADSPQAAAVDPVAAATSIFEGCIAAIPYAPAAAFLGSEKAKLDPREGEAPRVAIMADGIGSTHGVSRTLEEIRRRGVAGYEIEVIGTDPDVDRRLAAVADIEVPFYPGLHIGVPALPAAVETLAEGAFDAIHVCSPGPVGIAGALVARTLGLPLIGSYHTELAAYAGLRSGAVQLAAATSAAVQAFYGACDVVLSPSPASDAALAQIGVGKERVARWDRGVDTGRFDPALRGELELPGECNVLYAGRITREKGVELLVDAFLDARARDPRLHLVLAGGGPEEERVRERVGEHATFLGWLQGAELARAYASADIFLFGSATDTFGQVILEAQASGVPVVAVAAGGPLSLVEDRVSGLLAPARSDALAECVLELAAAPLLRARLAGVALSGVRARTWEGSMERLGEGYRVALARAKGGAGQAGPPAPARQAEQAPIARAHARAHGGGEEKMQRAA